MPTSFTISGSNDRLDWTVLDRRSGVSGYAMGTPLPFTAPSQTGMYRFLKLSSFNLGAIGEIRYFGSLEIDVPNQFTLLTNTAVNASDISWSREITAKTSFECAEICGRESACRMFVSNVTCTLFAQDPATLPRTTQNGALCGIKK